jgi:succinate dehydrogenase / fumarate reductase membrane anchor subunit
MSESGQKFHSALSVAKGHGASHSGVHHWWFQRVTAVALMVLLPWFVASLIVSMLSNDVSQAAAWFALPLNAIGMLALVIAMFWHAKLGLQVVIEDYVHTPAPKYVALLANNFICWGFALLGILAVLRLHFIDVTSYPT